MAVEMSTRRLAVAGAVGGLALLLGGITVASAQSDDSPRLRPAAESVEVGDDSTSTTVADTTTSTVDDSPSTTVDDCLRGDGTFDDRCAPGGDDGPTATTVPPGTTPTTVDDCLRGDGTFDDRCAPGGGGVDDHGGDRPRAEDGDRSGRRGGDDDGDHHGGQDDDRSGSGSGGGDDRSGSNRGPG